MTAALELDDLVVRFGGNTAVSRLSLSVERGQIGGLIGPNGAGKTTTFNACTGLLRPNHGRVLLFGTDVTTLGPAARAQMGLGRTFQRMELFESLTVAANVRLACEAQLSGRRLWRMLWAARTEQKAVDDAAEEALALCGIDGLAARRVVELSTGHRRLVELARVLATSSPLLLLDEPSSGLDAGETRSFGAILRRAVKEQGRTILLVEHDMTLVRAVCDHVDVLDFGQHLIGGDPASVLESQVVRRAYLGEGLDDVTGDSLAGASSPN